MQNEWEKFLQEISFFPIHSESKGIQRHFFIMTVSSLVMVVESSSLNLLYSSQIADQGKKIDKI